MIDIGPSLLHITNSSFNSLLNILTSSIDLDQVATYLHFLFKISASWREDYKILGWIMEVTAHNMKIHMESCWLSIDKSVFRILEQIGSLLEYFFNTVPKQKLFNHKNGLAGNKHYKRIASILKDPKAEIYMPFIVCTSQSFNCFLKPLQSSSPMIHWLYSMCLGLLHKLLEKVIEGKFLKKDDKLVSAKKLKQIHLWSEESQKV